MRKELCVKKALIVIISTLIGIVFTTTGFSEGMHADKSQKLKFRVKSKGDFVGKVDTININDKIISVRNKGLLVTFDVTNPRLIGYKSIDQIKSGDPVSISYTGDGIIISRFTGKIPVMPTGPAFSQQKRTAYASKKGGPVRVRERSSSTAFNDVDHSSDGRISPAELSAVMPGLTMEQFKRYDKNGDGCLSKSEYDAIR